ncbi:hypothetical protein J6590_093481, partial [Homalodisca vitripennis]
LLSGGARDRKAESPSSGVIFNLHYQNAHSHTGFVVTNYLTLNKTPVVRQAPYSPRLQVRLTCVDEGSFQWLHVKGSELVLYSTLN